MKAVFYLHMFCFLSFYIHHLAHTMHTVRCTVLASLLISLAWLKCILDIIQHDHTYSVGHNNIHCFNAVGLETEFCSFNAETQLHTTIMLDIENCWYQNDTYEHEVCSVIEPNLVYYTCMCIHTLKIQQHLMFMLSLLLLYAQRFANYAIFNPSKRSIYKGGYICVLSYSEIKDFLPTESDHISLRECVFRPVEYVLGHSDNTHQKNIIAVHYPLQHLPKSIPFALLSSIARFHDISFGRGARSKENVLSKVQKHICKTCPTGKLILAVGQPQNVSKRVTKHRSKLETYISDQPHFVFKRLEEEDNRALNPVSFPPPPPSLSLRDAIIRDWCKDIDTTKLEESGCAVCGLISPSGTLSPLKSIKNMLGPVSVDGVSRVPRTSTSSPIKSFPGPVLDYACKNVCLTCRTALRNGNIPDNALSNGTWIGPVPSELQDLTFLEKILIQRTRTNRCFVRVSTGSKKMISHAIAFDSPVAKIYSKLPPPVSDIDDILVVLFTGPCEPTEKDWKRSPVLIRRQKVLTALKWLQINNSLYHDIVIDREALSSYPENSPPVSVEYKEMNSNRFAESMSQNDDGEDIGTADGPCPFVLHGLQGSQLESMTVKQQIAKALEHLDRKGAVLAVGHAAESVSMWDSPELYCNTFPWLFPYGLGGVGMVPGMSKDAHVKRLLMYHDKRFQLDQLFSFVAFSHKQVRAATRGGFLATEKKNFALLSERMLNINTSVLSNLAKKLALGTHVTCESDEERNCFNIIKDLGHVDSKVSGSVTSKRYMRSEIWSMISFLGAPTWYITLSPADHNSPISLYLADSNEKFVVRSTPLSVRTKKIADNPVAAAKFFHFMIEMFIKHILGAGTKHHGLFGETAGYYGTVEQQGRLTLHMHMLLFIAGSLTPQEIRERLMQLEEPFTQSLISYLESLHSASIKTGNHMELYEYHKKSTDDINYENPLELLPQVPPPICQAKNCSAECVYCATRQSWEDTFDEDIDAIHVKVNTHICRTTLTKSGAKNKKYDFTGCLDNKYGTCKARFPREIIKESIVDEETGALSIKHLEPQLNKTNNVVTYLLRSNTDVSTMSSGTAINGVVFYVCDYITKSPLKTHVIFNAIQSVYAKNAELIAGTSTQQHKARRLITQIVNSLSAKAEYGAPMINLYLLDNPDHYTNFEFKVFYWQSFVKRARSYWLPETETQEEKIVFTKVRGRVVDLSNVYDYTCRPLDFESMCLYDWQRFYTRVKLRKKGSQGKNLRTFYFTPDHPLQATHGVTMMSYAKGRIPNFAGAGIPRNDAGDMDTYSCTMLVLFAPWRSGQSLKQPDETWSEAYEQYKFSPRHRTLMKNFQIRYECMDARDDFHNQMRKKQQSNKLPSFVDPNYYDDFEMDDIDAFQFAHAHDNDETILLTGSKKYQQLLDNIDAYRMSLQERGWTTPSGQPIMEETGTVPRKYGINWKEIVQSKRTEVAAQRLAGRSGGLRPRMLQSTPNQVKVVNKDWILRTFSPPDTLPDLIATIKEFDLNEEQERAFRLVANHACCKLPSQLKMYIGGMGGTGKTQVLRAIQHFFAKRSELHRIVIVAPTGTAASLLSGWTYHYMFGINSQAGDDKMTSITAVCSRLEGVDYVFLDEVSMLSCHDMYLISARLAIALNNPDIPFGGMNLIFAGDFAQLPPAIGGESAALYSRLIGLPHQTGMKQQESAIGKSCWHQVIRVVILHKNMRQKTQSAEDAKLRTVLENMRYAACTSSDLAFLDSRISSQRNGENHIASSVFRNVSVITAFNKHKDEFNRLGAIRFAAETNQELLAFHSEDMLKVDDDAVPVLGKKRKRKTVKALSTALQDILWSLPSCCTKRLVPGILNLCKGLPVMIRNNSATELGITKGQEATVYDWEDIIGSSGKPVLKTLFVKLLNPNTNVQLTGLPLNVVPITQTTVTQQCTLPDDSTVTIVRKQVEVLPNFAMTDYASQGKTRPINVVDITNCRTHQGIYTALSRSASAAGTLVLQPYKKDKITGGTKGDLRQEFRELAVLDEITKLEYEGKLPARVTGETRRELIASFRSWKGENYNPKNIHPSLKWNRNVPWVDDSLDDVSWSILAKNTALKDVAPNENNEEQELEHISKKIRKTKQENDVAILHSGAPHGPKWKDNSCAYDCFVMSLRVLWYSSTKRTKQVLQKWSSTISEIVNSFDVETSSLTDTTETLRQHLYQSSPTKYPWKGMASYNDICHDLLKSKSHVFQDVLKCLSCLESSLLPSRGQPKTVSIIAASIVPQSVSDFINNWNSASKHKCVKCGSTKTQISHEFIRPVPFLSFELANVVPSDLFIINIDNKQFTYNLSSVTYYADEHFFVRVITEKTHVWIYDGLDNNGVCKYEGTMSNQTHMKDINKAIAIGATYILAN
jgi:hypothetical protein